MPAASPWRRNVGELLRHHGSRRTIQAVAPLPGLTLTSAVVPEGADIVADLVLESIADGSITATGTLTVPWEGECRRCLRPIAGVAVLDVQEVFTARPQEGDDTYPLDTDVVDLEPMVHDASLLALPLAPLCSEACVGPAPDAHPVSLDVAAPAESPEPDAPPEPGADPRWAGLAELRLDD